MPTTSTRTKLPRAAVPSGSAKKIVRSCTIKKEPAELFRFWRNLENIPRISRHVLSVTRISDKESHWKVRGPRNRVIEWDAIIINEHPNELIAWESNPDGEIKNAGSVRFTPAPTGQGTEVTVSFDFVPPAGRIGAALTKLTGKEPESQVEDDLMRFKALMETGEIPNTKGQPTGPSDERRRNK